MIDSFSRAISHPNIALIKYWGNKNKILRIPTNNSISFNLSGLFTETSVEFLTEIRNDELILNGKPTFGLILERMSNFLDLVRLKARRTIFARVVSTNNFPISAGIASSASAFSALALAATNAIGLRMTERQLSQLARRGSGSACRSIPDGFVEWMAGTNDSNSYAKSIAPANHWNIVDCIAITQTDSKPIGSSEGQNIAHSSPLQEARIKDAPRRLELCTQAIHERDFEKLAAVVELDSNMMHAVMMTSSPPILYWHPTSIHIMQQIPSWRKTGIPVCYTLDAGPNVHVICTYESAQQVVNNIKNIPGVLDVLCAQPSEGARVISAN